MNWLNICARLISRAIPEDRIPEAIKEYNEKQGLEVSSAFGPIKKGTAHFRCVDDSAWTSDCTAVQENEEEADYDQGTNGVHLGPEFNQRG